MLVRNLTPEDLPRIAEIHGKFYSGEFDIEELFENTIGMFAVTDELGNIICVGGVRPIVEAVLITDKEVSVKDRRAALYRVLDASEFVTRNAGFEQIHVFIQDEDWKKHLMKAGFKPTKGESLVKIMGQDNG